MTAKKAVLAAALFTTWLATALAASSGGEDVSGSSAASNSWFGPEFGVLQKVYDDCQNRNDFTGCLKGKALQALTKAASQVCVCVFCGCDRLQKPRRENP